MLIEEREESETIDQFNLVVSNDICIRPHMGF